MGIQQKLQIGLSQRLVLTPSLQQAIKLLPLSRLELINTLNQELVENPLLEELQEDELHDIIRTTSAETADVATPEIPERQDTWDDSDYEYFFGDYLDSSRRQGLPQETRKIPAIENTLSTSSSLSDHLLWQLLLRTSEGVLREIGRAIIGNLNTDGYLAASIDEIVSMGDWETGKVRIALELIQSFDPPGIAARSVKECLWLQIQQLGLDETPSGTIVHDHLALLESHQLAELSRLMETPLESLRKHIEIIKALDPKPGSRLNVSPSQYVVPDVSIVKVEDEYIVVMNEDSIPQLRVSPVYRRMLRNRTTTSPETMSYIREKFRSALWFIKSVDQRQKTIVRVATSIIKLQQDFLDHGINHLRPLVLRDVASDIGMHESTISRVVNNKYMHTPRGVFEMKFFFHSAIHTLSGTDVSSVTIKERIRKLVSEEDSRKPLSDTRIVGLLQQDGLVLARRTISKYREELRIPMSSQRKATY